MTRFQTILFDPANIKANRKTDRDIPQGKVPITTLEELFPIEVTLEPPKLSRKKISRFSKRCLLSTPLLNPLQPPPEEEMMAAEVPEPAIKEEAKVPGGESWEADWKELFYLAVNLHREGIDGNKDAVRECHEILEFWRQFRAIIWPGPITAAPQHCWDGTPLIPWKGSTRP